MRKDQAIIDAMAELMLKQSIEKISINDIAKTAGINRGTFYLHYDDKYQVVESLENSLLAELKEMNRALDTLVFHHLDPEKPYPFFVDTYQWIGQNKKYFAALLGSNGDLRFILQLRTVIEEAFARLLKKNGLFFHRQDIVMRAVTAIILDFIVFYIEHCETVSPEEMSIICGRCVHGITSQFQ